MLRLDCNQKKLDSLFVLEVHGLEDMVPAEREELSSAFLESLRDGWHRHGKGGYFSVLVLDKSYIIEIQEAEIVVQKLSDCLVRERGVVVEVTIGLVDKVEYLLGISSVPLPW